MVWDLASTLPHPVSVMLQGRYRHPCLVFLARPRSNITSKRRWYDQSSTKKTCGFCIISVSCRLTSPNHPTPVKRSLPAGTNNFPSEWLCFWFFCGATDRGALHFLVSSVISRSLLLADCGWSRRRPAPYPLGAVFSHRRPPSPNRANPIRGPYRSTPDFPAPPSSLATSQCH